MFVSLPIRLQKVATKHIYSEKKSVCKKFAEMK